MLRYTTYNTYITLYYLLYNKLVLQLDISLDLKFTYVHLEK